MDKNRAVLKEFAQGGEATLYGPDAAKAKPGAEPSTRRSFGKILGGLAAAGVAVGVVVNVMAPQDPQAAANAAIVARSDAKMFHNFEAQARKLEAKSDACYLVKSEPGGGGRLAYLEVESCDGIRSRDHRRAVDLAHTLGVSVPVAKASMAEADMEAGAPVPHTREDAFAMARMIDAGRLDVPKAP